MKQYFIFSFLLITSSAALAQRVQKLNDNLWSITYQTYQNKVLIAPFDTFVAIIESPQNDTLARNVIATVDSLFPNQPIRYLFHSHHHSHSIAGVDVYLKRGITVVTTPFNLATIKAQTNDTITLLKQTILLDSTFRLADSQNELIAYRLNEGQKLGTYLIPTKEYMVFYQPRRQTLVSGCLYNKPLSYHEVVNARKPALNQFILDKKLAVTYLIPTNTCRSAGFEDVCTLTMLTETLQKGLKPNEVADYFQSQSIEFLQTHSDSLAAAYRSQIPRDFDWIVCANTLGQVRKDYNRAILIFKMLIKLFPNQFGNYYSVGLYYEQKGDLLEAVAYYQKALSLTTNPADRQEIEAIINQTQAK